MSQLQTRANLPPLLYSVYTLGELDDTQLHWRGPSLPGPTDDANLLQKCFTSYLDIP